MLGASLGFIAILVVPALDHRFGSSAVPLDEERFLAANLAGYREYQQQVRHRLIPGIW